MSNVIEVENLTKIYGSRAAILDLSFTVAQGRILGLLGPNGAGKTTTMRILTGYMPPTRGSAHVAGCDAFKDSLELRRHIGYLPERVPLYDDMTVVTYLEYAGRIHRMCHPQLRQRVLDVCEMLNVMDLRGRLIGKLSRGQRQRVGIAQALLHDPEVLILDEPTVGLDPRQIIETRQLIKSLGGQHTVVLSSHILPEVSQIADEVVIIYEGRVVAQDSPEQLTLRLQSEQTYDVVVRGPQEKVEAALRHHPVIASFTTDPLDTNVTRYHIHPKANSDTLIEELATLVVQSGWGLRELIAVRPTLEEVYLKLTTEEDIEAA